MTDNSGLHESLDRLKTIASNMEAIEPVDWYGQRVYLCDLEWAHRNVVDHCKKLSSPACARCSR